MYRTGLLQPKTAAGLTEEEIGRLLVLDIKDTDYFQEGGAPNQHGGGNLYIEPGQHRSAPPPVWCGATMLMCRKAAHKNLLDNHLLFRTKEPLMTV